MINATNEHIASFIQQILIEHILGARHVLDKSLVKQWMRSSWKGPRLILMGEGGGELQPSAYLINRARTKLAYWQAKLIVFVAR